MITFKSAKSKLNRLICSRLSGNSGSSIIEKNERLFFYRFFVVFIIFGLIGFLFIPIDKGVPVDGFLKHDGNNKVVQYLGDGIVEKINISEGAHVNLGDVLLVINNIDKQSEYDASAFEIESLEKQIEVLKNSIVAQEEYLNAAREHLLKIEKLTKEGYYAVSKYLDAKKSYMASKTKYYDDNTKLNDLRGSVLQKSARIKSLAYNNLKTTIVAPVSGKVLDLKFFTVGGVVKSGDVIAQIAPDDANLIVEADAPDNLIDKIDVGLDVHLNFVALNQSITPKIPAIVTAVSPDRYTDQDSGKSYFKIYCDITPEGRKLLSLNKIKSGMPVQVYVVTGERSILSYITKPIIDRIRASMHEE